MKLVTAAGAARIWIGHEGSAAWHPLHQALPGQDVDGARRTVPTARRVSSVNSVSDGSSDAISPERIRCRRSLASWTYACSGEALSIFMAFRRLGLGRGGSRISRVTDLTIAKHSCLYFGIQQAHYVLASPSVRSGAGTSGSSDSHACSNLNPWATRHRAGPAQKAPC
jgi:hypothetical protein